MAVRKDDQDNFRPEEEKNSSQEDLIARGVPTGSVQRAVPRRAVPRRTVPRQAPARPNRTPSQPNVSPADTQRPLGSPIDDPHRVVENIQSLNSARQAAQQTFGRSLPEATLHKMSVPEIEKLVSVWQQRRPRQEILSPEGQSPLPPQPTPQQLLDLWIDLYPNNSGRQEEIRDALQENARQHKVLDSFVEAVYGAGLGPHDPNQEFINRTNQAAQPPPSTRQTPPPPQQQSSPSSPGQNEETQRQKNQAGQLQDAARERAANQTIAQANRQIALSNAQAKAANAQANAARQQTQAIQDYSQSLQDRRLSVVRDQLSRFSPEQQTEILERVIEEHNQGNPDQPIDPENPSADDLAQLEISLLAEMGRVTPEPQGIPTGDVLPPLREPSPEELERVQLPEDGLGLGTTEPENVSLPGVKPEEKKTSAPGPWTAQPKPLPKQPEEDEIDNITIVGERENTEAQSGRAGTVSSESASDLDENGDADDGVLPPEEFLQRVEGKTLEQLEQDPQAADTFYHFYDDKSNDVISRKAGIAKQEGYPALHYEKENGQQVIKEGGVSSQRPNNQPEFLRAMWAEWASQFPDGKIPEDYQGNHTIPVEIIDKDDSELLNKYQELGLSKAEVYARIIDIAENSYPLPSQPEVSEEAEQQGLNPLIHNGPHSQYTQEVIDRLDAAAEQYKADHNGSLDGITLKELDSMVGTLQEQLRDLHDHLGNLIRQGREQELPPYVNPDFEFSPEKHPEYEGRKFPRLSQEPNAPQATLVASAAPVAIPSSAAAVKPPSSSLSEVLRHGNPLEFLELPLKNAEWVQLKPIAEAAVATKPKLMGDYEHKATVASATDTAEGLDQERRQIKAKGDELDAEIREKQAYVNKGSRSILNPLGPPAYKIDQAKQSIKFLEDQRDRVVRPDFELTNEKLQETLAFRDNLETWESSSFNQEAILMLAMLDNPIVRPTVETLTAINNLHHQSLNIIGNASNPTEFTQKQEFEQAHHDFLHNNQMPSKETLQAMQKVVNDHENEIALAASTQEIGAQLEIG